MTSESFLHYFFFKVVSNMKKIFKNTKTGEENILVIPTYILLSFDFCNNLDIDIIYNDQNIFQAIYNDRDIYK